MLASAKVTCFVSRAQWNQVLLGLALVALVVHVIIDVHRLPHATASALATSMASFATPPRRQLDVQQDSSSSSSQAQATPRTKSRVLLGIFTMNDADNRRYRDLYRPLLKMSYPRVCHIGEYRDYQLNPKANISDSRLSECELVYTFVLGGGDDETDTVLLDDSRPMLTSPPPGDKMKTFTWQTRELQRDGDHPDMTWLNIKENMEDGKSQTFLYYGAQQPGIDYVSKADTDTLMYLDKFFEFKEEYLPPPPYNKHVLASHFADKWWWGKNLNEDVPEMAEKEGLFRVLFGSVFHVYCQGQFYLMSTDVCIAVADGFRQNSTAPFLEGIEDHDVSAMAFQSGDPIQMIPIPQDRKFWKHPVKMRKNGWKKAWRDELIRIDPGWKTRETCRTLYTLC